MATQQKLHTIDDLWELSHQAGVPKRFELVKGVIVEMSPTGDMHGVVTGWLYFLIMSHVDAHDLGEVTAAETGFILSGGDPPTVRAPDVAFITKGRLTPMTGRYYPIAPDLAVEVVSPNDTASEIREKVSEYLQAGTRLVWVAYPESRVVDAYPAHQGVRRAEREDVLDGGDVLPGFRVSVSEVFRKLRD